MSGGGVGPGSSLWSLSSVVSPWVDDEHVRWEGNTILREAER